MSDSFDPDERIRVGVTFHSPHVVRYRLWYRRPGETQWTVFATGSDEASTDTSSHAYEIGPLSEGSEIAYYAEFSGNPETTFRVEIGARQAGVEIKDAVIEGTTDTDGVAKREGRFTLE